MTNPDFDIVKINITRIASNISFYGKALIILLLILIRLQQLRRRRRTSALFIFLPVLSILSKKDLTEIKSRSIIKKIFFKLSIEDSN